MEVHGIFIVELNKALRTPGCPICNIRDQASDRYFRFFLHENINDVATRIILQGSLGFCKKHAWQCQEMELRDYQDGMKHGILYEWLLQTILKKIPEIKQNLLVPEEPQSRFWQKKKPGQNSSPLTRTRYCPVCVSENEAERLYLRLLINGLSDAKILTDYQAGDGLCLPHFIKAMNLEIEKEPLLMLCDLQMTRIKGLIPHLTSYVEKHDYQNKESYTEEELDSWIKAVQIMAGNKD